MEVVAEWADQRLAWTKVSKPTLPPKFRLLLLGSAGTGKTHSAQVGINEVRLLLGSYESVLTMAFSGVAAANLGTGSRTTDSLFHTNHNDASEDLTGGDLDTLVEELGCVHFIVIDEVSTCSASTLEVVSRRMQQVTRALWRRRFNSAPPDDLGPFGGVGVLLMGDFGLASKGQALLALT